MEIREKFYQGKQLDEKEFDACLGEINSINVVGEESINFVLVKELIKKQDIKKIQNIPYAIIVF